MGKGKTKAGDGSEFLKFNYRIVYGRHTLDIDENSRLPVVFGSDDLFDCTMKMYELRKTQQEENPSDGNEYFIACLYHAPR